MYYYMNPRRKIMVLQIIIVIGIIAIAYGITILMDQSAVIDDEISSLDLKCPKCPDLTNPISKSDLNINVSPAAESPATKSPAAESPACPACPVTKCPSVEDIVSGIFPGRNTGVTSSGRYFDVKAVKSYDLLPDYGFYKAEDAFPEDSILDPPLRWSNLDAPLNDINNSIDNEHVDTNASASFRRMNFGPDQQAKRTDRKMKQSVHPPLESVTPPEVA